MKNLLLILCLAISINANAQCWSNVSAGYSHTLALKTDGTIWAWGLNGNGQLGNGTLATQIIPMKPIKIGNSTDWIQVRVGHGPSYAIKTDGTLWAWGYNGNGQLGDGTFTDKNVPTQIGNAMDWRQIYTEVISTHGIKTDGTLWAWGNNYYGQLGDGTNIVKTVPIQIGTATNWSQISAGGNSSTLGHTIALKTDGSLWAWGNNDYRQLGDGTSVSKNSPIQIGTATDWAQISAGNVHTLALKNDGTLWAWGNNIYYQLGDGTQTTINVPTQIGIDTNWKNIDAAYMHNIAIKTDGTLWAWGNNSYGQLGNGSLIYLNTPTQIDFATDWNVISAAGYNSFAIKSDGNLLAWGYNYYGQLGDSTLIDNNIPIQIDFVFNCFSLPSITTTQASSITNNTASSGGNISSDGGDAVTTRGACWNTSGNPTIADFITTDGVGIGSFPSALTGLTAGTTYKVRAYATNSLGTAYGNEITFSTNTLGINENIFENISIHPNPTNSTFTISGINQNDFTSIEILDITGKLLFKTNSPINIDLSNYENGVYFYRIIGEKNYMGKIVKE